MNLFEDTNPRALKELLGEIHSRTAVLPDFQRDFVWDPGATQELIVSIANNYPAGSILRVRDAKRVFAAREFEGAPKLNGARHTFLVLDGQQRLTSLYQAFYGVGDHRYFLDLKKLIDGRDFDDAIFHLRATRPAAKELEQFEVQARDLVLPLGVLKGGAGGFLHWLLQVTNPMPSEQRTRMLDALTKLNDEWLKIIDDYHFPVVTLSDKTEPDALCTIFETLNRTGVKLSVFELLTARFWTDDLNLREKWDAAKAAHPCFDNFELDPYYVLQAVSLVAPGRAPSCKRGAVLNLTAEDVRTSWDSVIAGFAQAFEILEDDCRVVLPRWLPYQTMLPPMAAALARGVASKAPSAGARRQQIARWFWCSVFGQTYENSANSQSAKDVPELHAWFDGGSPPESVRDFKFDTAVLRDTTPRQRALYSGAICVILGSGTGARDFHTKAVITRNLMLDERIDDHHVFPDNFLEKKLAVASKRLRDCVLNRTLIDRTTNQMISNRAPSRYLRDIKATPGFPFDDVLASHCLPTGDGSPLMSDEFEEFLNWRQQRLGQEIAALTGPRVST
ncbi:MAG: DUF262 domain-containing protein [Acidobacteria bacterium]|nr:DUF262 domain-containing protein [Acidobacteriota bacterium]